MCRVYSNVDNIQDIFFQCFCFSFNMFNKNIYISMCAHDQWTSYFPHSMLKSFFPFFTQFLFHYKNFGWKNHPFLRIGKCLLETVVGKYMECNIMLYSIPPIHIPKCLSHSKRMILCVFGKIFPTCQCCEGNPKSE